MNIEVIYKISPTYRHIYHFEVFDDGSVEYEGIMRSYRNDTKDIWGDQWHKHFEKEKAEEILKVNNKYEVCYFYENEYENNYEYRNAIDKINQKYNPIRNKTVRGESYYSGTYFGSTVDKEDRPIPTKKELNKLIKKEIAKQLKKGNINNL